MGKKNLIGDIINQLDGCNVDVNGLWINNSDGDGEDIEVVSVGYKDGVVGLFMADGDFYSLEELSYDECEMVFDCMLEIANK